MSEGSNAPGKDVGGIDRYSSVRGRPSCLFGRWCDVNGRPCT